MQIPNELTSFIDDADAFADYVRTRDDSRLRDLAIAFGCLCGNAAAIAAFESEVLPAARVGLSSYGEIDVSAVRDHVLPPPSGVRGTIAQYTGRSRLHAWVRVVIVRLKLQEKRRATPQLPTSEEVWHPEGAHLDQALVKEVVRASFGSLQPRDRRLMRAYFFEAKTLQELAGAYQVSVSTMFRSLEAAKAQVFASTQRELRVRGIEWNDVASLFSGGIISSDILRTPTPA